MGDTGLIFGGAITTTQLIIIVIAIVCILLALKFVKKIAKLVVCAIIAVLTLVYCGVLSPDQVGDITQIVQEKGEDAFKTIAENSDNIRIDTKEGFNIELFFNDEWHGIDEITKMVINGDKATLLVGEENVIIDDKYVVMILELIKK